MKIESQKITYEFGRLKKVYYLSFKFENESDLLAACHLKFENGEVYHEALPDYDEISCDSKLQNNYQAIVDVSSEPLWKNAIDKRVLWSWDLENQQGYRDSVQYSFANTVEDEEVIIQLAVCASQLRIYMAERKL